MNTVGCSIQHLTSEDRPALQDYELAFERWIDGVEREMFENVAGPGEMRRMWADWIAWARAGGLKLGDIGASDLEAYLQTLVTRTSCDKRYAHILLELVDAVLLDHARRHDLQPNRAARVVLLHRSNSNVPVENQPGGVVVDFATRPIPWAESNRHEKRRKVGGP